MCRWLVLVFVTGCGSRQAPSNDGFTPRSTVTRTKPESFLGLAGLTSVTESRHSSDWSGHGVWSHMIVFRGETVVCDFPFEQSGSHEDHRFDENATLELTSREPLRFHIETHAQSSDLGTETRCAGFELPRSGSCRKVFERSCTHETCKPTVTLWQRGPGSGTLKGHVTRAREPVVGATVVVGSQFSIADEEAAFVLEVGPGAHVLEISGGVVDSQRVPVSMAPDEDAEISVDIACSDVIDGSCCRF
jgi:hypothetical protein